MVNITKICKIIKIGKIVRKDRKIFYIMIW